MEHTFGPDNYDSFDPAKITFDMGLHKEGFVVIHYLFDSRKVPLRIETPARVGVHIIENTCFLSMGPFWQHGQLMSKFMAVLEAVEQRTGGRMKIVRNDPGHAPFIRARMLPGITVVKSSESTADTPEEVLRSADRADITLEIAAWNSRRNNAMVIVRSMTTYRAWRGDLLAAIIGSTMDYQAPSEDVDLSEEVI